MREGFRAIVSGWTTQTGFGPLTDRIEEAAEWAKANGPLEPDEQRTVELMIRAQIARAEEEGFGVFQLPPARDPVGDMMRAIGYGDDDYDPRG